MNATTIAAIGTLPVLWIACLLLLRYRRLRRERSVERRGQQRFADLVGLRPEYVEALERTERNPSFVTLSVIARGLQVPINDLLATQPPIVGGSPEGGLVSCPGCDSTTDAVINAYRAGRACPVCGLPAAVLAEVEAAQRRAIWAAP